TEGAVKLARQYWLANDRPEKFLVISRWQGFHGMTLGATGFSGHTGRRRKYAPMIQDMPKIPPAYAYRCADCAAGSLRCAVVPDILVAAKGASGGYAPLSVLTASEQIVRALRTQGAPFVAGHTYAQNPVVATAGLAVLDHIQRHELVQAAKERGAQLERGLT